MNPAGGRQVRLFLVDGTPSGIITAEIMNWTGHVLTGSRNSIGKFLARPELERTGVYFLYGRNLEEGIDTPTVYVGESDNVRKRLAQHNKDESKGYWERTCVVTSKDQNITKAHARYLESRLIAIAQEVGQITLGNTTMPPPIALPEADKSDMEFFIHQIRLILPVLGLDFLRNKPLTRSSTSPTSPDDSPVFELASKKHGLSAQAHEVDSEFVVLAGSLAKRKWGGRKKGYSKLHKNLIEQGRLVITPEQEDLVCFNEDVPFSSPSAASSVIHGRSSNGRTSWRVKGKNVTYAEWQEQQVAKIAPTSDENSDYNVAEDTE